MVEAVKKEWTRDDLNEIKRQARDEVEVRDRSYHFRTYPKCFVANEMATWMVDKGHAADRNEAIKLGRALVENYMIEHVCRDHTFKD